MNASEDDLGGTENEDSDIDEEIDFSSKCGQLLPLQLPAAQLQLNNNCRIDSSVVVDDGVQPSTSQGLGTVNINSEEQAQQFLQDNPYLGRVFRKMIQEEISCNSDTTSQPPAPPRDHRAGNVPKQPQVQTRELTVKSPSDTTIYAPGLKQLTPNQRAQDQHMINRISNFV